MFKASRLRPARCPSAGAPGFLGTAPAVSLRKRRSWRRLWRRRTGEYQAAKVNPLRKRTFCIEEERQKQVLGRMPDTAKCEQKFAIGWWRPAARCGARRSVRPRRIVLRPRRGLDLTLRPLQLQLVEKLLGQVEVARVEASVNAA
jgi:hypothetical protein